MAPQVNERKKKLPTPSIWSCSAGHVLFQLVLAYSLSQNTIESAETSRLLYQPNQPFVGLVL
jgi:hypothetical protein